MGTELDSERSLGKHMGCITGFFQLFDRHHILTGKRLRYAKRPVVDTTMTSESERSAAASPVIPRETGKAKQAYSAASPSPEPPRQSPLRSPLAAVAESPAKSPIPLPILELKEGGGSSWKFWREAPRLSLDSRANTDAKGGLHPKQIRTAASIRSTADGRERTATDATDESQHHRSPGVVVRLMGLEPFPDSNSSETESKPELRRSASESRVSRALFPSRIIAEGSNSSDTQHTKSQSVIFNDVVNDLDQRKVFPTNANKAESPTGFNRGSFNSPLPWRAPPLHKSFFDSGDFYPEPKQKASLYGELENRLKMRGVNEHSKDLESLKQILEALQLKGLLHPRKPSGQNQIRRRNFVYDESPIVVMKPSRLLASTPLNRRMRNDYCPSNVPSQWPDIRRNYVAGANALLPRERNVRSSTILGRSQSPTTRSGRRSSSEEKPKASNVETQKKMNKPGGNRRVSLVQPPKLNPGRAERGPTANNKSCRTKKTTAEVQKEQITTVLTAEDESSISSISGSSITTSTDTEIIQRSKAEEYKEGRNLLDRCDKLIHSIAEMTAADMQPSPESVLDSSFYKDELLTPSPVTTKHNIVFKDHSTYQSDELEEGTWSPMVSPIRSKWEETPGDSDLIYISDILRASHYFPECSDVFLLLEKQQYLKGKDISKLSMLQRKLIFDTVNEILDRSRLLPPWSVMNKNITKPSLDRIWLEFQRIREQNTAEDMSDTICGVLKKDLARDVVPGWGDNKVEMSEMILGIERLVFKDLITETIRDLVVLDSSTSPSQPSMTARRKLVFCKS